MMQRKHPGEAMTGAPGALPGEAIRPSHLDCRAAEWRRGVTATMRQTHAAGEKLFVDFAGETRNAAQTAISNSSGRQPFSSEKPRRYWLSHQYLSS